MRLALLTMLLTGCLSESSFPSHVANELCPRFEACQPISFAEVYTEGGEEACEEDQERSMEVILASSEKLQCTWDEKRAKACLDGIRSQACDGFSVAALLDRCAQAWGCAD